MTRNKKPKLISGVTLSKEMYQNTIRFVFQHSEKDVIAELGEESYIALSLFDGCHSLEDIASVIQNSFDISKDQLKVDLAGLCKKLEAFGLMEH